MELRNQNAQTGKAALETSLVTVIKPLYQFQLYLRPQLQRPNNIVVVHVPMLKVSVGNHVHGAHQIVAWD